eukprot:TRINITY_DN19183_c0_g2_i2.p1 TRINITY_DN19183_c0_g2~~TRINITY_DN19183_c0_g2_i2.p1  ORF type:complete len:173 (+),score=35.29 TRINITY_DN19183_c0_g2_i2:87-605(+)
MASESARVLYEFCIRNTFIDEQPVISQDLRRSKSVPAFETSYDIFCAPADENDVSNMHAKKVDQKPCAESPKESDAEVKMFIGNVSFHVTAERMEKELHMLGFKGTYSSVNFPLKSPGCTRGYGFVVFRREHDAVRFASVFGDYRFQDSSSKKKCYVKYARGKQGDGTSICV